MPIGAAKAMMGIPWFPATTFDAATAPSGVALSSDKLTATFSTAARRSVRSANQITGAVYFEFKIISFDASTLPGVGIVSSTHPLTEVMYLAANGWEYTAGGTLASTTGGVAGTTAGYVAGDIIGVYAAAPNIWFSKNGVLVAGNPAAGTGATFTNLTGTVYAACDFFNGTGNVRSAVITAAYNPSEWTYVPVGNFGFISL